MPYRSLDATRIEATARQLELRVATRFPDAGLRQVAAEIVALSRDSAAAARALEGPIWWLRLLLGAMVLAGAMVFIFIGAFLPLGGLTGVALRSVESIEAVINTSVLAALGVTALVQLESRIKRRRVAVHLHALRSVIHVIDMHQLTKDPLALSMGYVRTTASPSRAWSAPDLVRYLDYCSELIAIIEKLAALFAQSVNDDAVSQAVHDIEMLGSALSRTVWQKIMLLEKLPMTAVPRGQGAATDVVGPAGLEPATKAL